ncbi:hypothetical protein KJ742_07215, partial [Patescibacteria group bacterium]|nr:hypothetical protein [Patescibacteria group bacterium]
MKAKSGKFKQLLLEIGLNDNESLIYIELLNCYPISVHDLSIRIGYPDIVVSRLINKLCKLKLVFYDSKEIWVINPEKAFTALLKERIWLITNTIYSDFNDIPHNLKPYCRKIISIYDNLISQSLAFYKRKSPISFSGIKVISDNDQFISLMSEKISQAKNEILSISSSPHVQGLGLIWGSIYERIINGVRYKRIIDYLDFSRTGILINSRDINEVGVNLHILDSSFIDQKFYVLDDDYLILFSPTNSEHYKFLPNGQFIKNKFIVSKFRESFEKIILKSINAEILLKILQTKKIDLINNAMLYSDKEELDWFISLIDYGIF